MNININIHEYKQRSEAKEETIILLDSKKRAKFSQPIPK